MKRIGFASVHAFTVYFVVFFAGGMLQGQSSYDLKLVGAVNSLSGSAGETKATTLDCTLTQSGGVDDGNGVDDDGAQGWSMSLTADNLAITSITTAGTSADKVPVGLWDGGFNKTQLSDPAKAGAKECAANGNKGAVSAIVLSLTLPITLGVNTNRKVAIIGVEGKIPSGADVTGTVRYADGCQGAGQPVDNNVTERGNTVKPSLGSFKITLHEVVKPPTCCGKRLNVGFSAQKVLKSSTVFSGVLDPGDGNCSAQGQITAEVAQGATGETTAYALISSEGAGEGVQGWSFSIALNGDIDFSSGTSATTAGTSADKAENGGYWDAGFNKTQIVDPAKPANAGQRGAVSAVVLSLTLPIVLPQTGTETVLSFGLKANAAQGAGDIVGNLKFQDGLVGAGQPVKNAITVGGGTENACNSGTAKVDIVFKLRVGQPVDSFRRGDPNDDGKVNIADGVWIINELIRSGKPTACRAAADINGDGNEDTSDAVFLVNYLFKSGTPPPAPFPGCAKVEGMPPAECPAGSVDACPE